MPAPDAITLQTPTQEEAMVDLSQKQELRNRVEAKKKEIESTLERSKADSRQSSRDQLEAAENKLAELKSVLEDGWDDLSEAAAEKLNKWLSD